MKKFIDGLKIGAGFISIFTVFLIIGFYLVKARSGTTATPGDRLTASKWNELVGALSGVQTQITTQQTQLTTQQTQLTTLQSKFTGENRINATLNSPWVNYGGATTPAGYYKDSFGIVHLRGLIKGGTTSNIIFQLPVGYRASSRLIFSSIGNSALARIDADNSGAIRFVAGASSDYLSLDGITFRTY